MTPDIQLDCRGLEPPAVTSSIVSLPGSPRFAAACMQGFVDIVTKPIAFFRSQSAIEISDHDPQKYIFLGRRYSESPPRRI